ncbi:MAG: SpoIIE family protein phosphatase [Actinobacteria bacterium]|nr:SpoIIE family protein phosphatase [Actinomycetota bacterium]
MTNDPERVLSGPDEGFYAALLDDDPVELYENAPCGYLSMLLDGTVIKANATFFAWTGFNRADIIGRERFQNLLAPGDRIFYETHYAPLLRMQGSVREIAVELRLPDGRRLPVLANAILQGDVPGRPQVVRTVLFDARERRSYEQELVGARRRAEESEAQARGLAATLQATLLPPLDLAIPGLDVAGAYRPAGDGSTVGGDFYDIFGTGRGSHSVVLGDVSGKGPSAAVVTALARYAIRAEALHSSSPAQVLRLVHEVMARYQPDRFCTAVLLEVTPTPDGADVMLAVAGHERPILTDGQTCRRVGDLGTILGMLPAADVVDTPVPLRPADAMVLYTDGISEARRGDEFFDSLRIETLVTELAAKGSAADIATGLADAAVAFQNGNPRDDIAVVVLKASGV